MDRHKIPYLEKSYPYGFHLFATISFSKPIPASQQTFAPVLQVSKSLGETEVIISFFLFNTIFLKKLVLDLSRYNRSICLFNVKISWFITSFIPNQRCS